MAKKTAEDPVEAVEESDSNAWAYVLGGIILVAIVIVIIILAN